MVEMQLIESLSRISCGLALVLFSFIALFSRSEQTEKSIQRILAIICFTSAILLFLLSINGGTFYGSTALPPILALACIVIGIGANLNIKGTNISQGMNPHEIMRLVKEEE